MEVRKYFVKEAYRFNLDSMLTRLICTRYKMEDGECEEVEIMGKVYDVITIDEIIDEVENLISTVMSYGKVTGREYGRIKQISEARDIMRYAKCIASGMSEDNAAYAFMS